MVKRKNSQKKEKRRYAAHTHDMNEKLYEKTQKKKSVNIDISVRKLF